MKKVEYSTSICIKNRILKSGFCHLRKSLCCQLICTHHSIASRLVISFSRTSLARVTSKEEKTMFCCMTAIFTQQSSSVSRIPYCLFINVIVFVHECILPQFATRRQAALNLQHLHSTRWFPFLKVLLFRRFLFALRFHPVFHKAVAFRHRAFRDYNSFPYSLDQCKDGWVNASKLCVKLAFFWFSSA